MQVGKFDVSTLETCRFGLDGGAMFGVVPKNLWSKAYHPGDEQNRIPMAARILLIRWDSHVMLVDTGNGDKMSEKLKSIYGLDNSQYTLSMELSKHGLNCNDITDVLLTHLHFDHAGGATISQNGEFLPAFPSAQYYVQQEHYEWALHPSVKDRASFWKENYEPVISRQMMKFVDGDVDLFEGVSVQRVNGHTKALQVVTVKDGGSTLVFPADLIPTHAHIPVPWVMGYDNYPLTTIDEKEKFLKRAVEENWIVVFEHDAFVRAGTIRATDKGFALAETIEL